MRKSTLSAQEIAELDEMKRKQTRQSGLSLMPIRDRGQAPLKNYAGGKVTAYWNTHRELQDGEARREVPDGMFLIDANGTTLAFNAEELKGLLRWA